MILGWLAAGFLAVPMSAQALLVTVGGKQWSIEAEWVFPQDDAALLEAQPWWNDFELTYEFAEAWYQADSATQSPFFAYRIDAPPDPCGQPVDVPVVCNLFAVPSGFPISDAYTRTDTYLEYAVATPVPLPGALGLLALGLASLLGLGTRRRRQVTAV